MPRCAQKRITRLDPDVEWLYDRLYDVHVEVVEVCTGCVYLRYPHQTEQSFFECDCGAGVMGLDEMEAHAQDCDVTNADEWFDSLLEQPLDAGEQKQAGEAGFQEVERPDCHIESYSYQWPLDGHRFSVSDGPD